MMMLPLSDTSKKVDYNQMPYIMKVSGRKRIRPCSNVTCFYNVQCQREIPMQYIGIKLISSCAHSPVVVLVYLTPSFMWLYCFMMFMISSFSVFIWIWVLQATTTIMKRKLSKYKCRIIWWCLRSSRLKIFCKKVVLRNLTKLIGKQLCQGLSFNKVAGLFTRTPFLMNTAGGCLCL